MVEPTHTEILGFGPSEANTSSHLHSIDGEGSPRTNFGHIESDDNTSDEVEFVYPTGGLNLEISDKPTSSRQSHPSPAQLESLYAAASSGDLPLLKRLFKTAVKNGDVESFALANHASTRTGLTALHVATSRGYHDIAVWLIEDCGAITDLEDREGETALHKAALNGHMSIVQYLLPDKADVHARDADGWTALHNACSKGYLDIVRWLCEKGGAASMIDNLPGVDIRSKDGWTPLMNAASKGHLPVVLYLLTKQGADPLIRNKWGETAFDVAAAVFEVWICEILQQFEAERWRGAPTPYNPLLVHTTIPLALYENQRLDMRLKTIAVSGGRPKFSPAGLGRHGHRAPFELKLPSRNEGAEATVPAWRSGIQLPLKEAPWVLPRPTTPTQPTLDGVERSHFWLSDWILDITHPAVDAQEGWQYAQSFDDPDDQWVAEMPPQLERIMTNNAIVPAGLGGGPSTITRPPHFTRAQPTWVRRRRWVRIMRRRLDIPPLPFLEADGAMYHLGFDGSLIPYKEDNVNPVDQEEGQELSVMQSTSSSSAQDYVARARYLVGNQNQELDVNGTSLSAPEARRAIAKLEQAVSELRQGLLCDEDVDRKIQAEVLLNAYSRELDRRRLSAGARGLLISDDEGYLDNDDDDDNSEEFHYPEASVERTSRPASRTSGSTRYSQRRDSHHVPADLTPQLTQAPEFRVPTHESPQKVLTPRWTPPTPRQVHAQWERDDAVPQCRDCNRRFSFLVRRHCRKCGRIFCDRCSSHRLMLDPADVVRDPTLTEVSLPTALHRVCQACYEEVSNNIPSSLHRSNTMEGIVVDQQRLTIPGSLSRTQSSSQLSDLADCPVCSQNLGEVGDAFAQETHVKNCLEGGAGTPQATRYLVYPLRPESALIGVECVICLEEFVEGSTIARLSCFCSFHNACLSSWLQRGKSCPVHAR